MKNGLDEQYIDLLKDILENGVEKQTRNGKTLSVFGRSIRYKFKDGKFPLLTTKKMSWKSIVTELLWFLKGDTNIKYLIDNDCHIWDGDAYKAYLNRFKGGLEPTTKERFIEMIKNDEESRVNANGWFIGELGPIYGKQWRRWRKAIINPKTGYQDFTYVDQIANLINDLKTNPDSRRLMVNAWNVGELDQMVLPPCHFSFQCYSHEKDGKRYLSLAWNQRSVDTFLGLPFNIASYGLLLEIIAKTVNMVPDELIGNLGDTHLYLNHIDQAKEQIDRKSFDLPILKHMKTDDFYKSLSENLSLLTHLDNTDFIIEGYQSNPHIKAPLSN
jgi:thymidylate synthase